MKKFIKNNWSKIVIVVIVIVLVSISLKLFLRKNPKNSQIANPASVNCLKNGESFLLSTERRDRLVCVRFQAEQSVKNGLILAENMEISSYYLKTSSHFNIINT